MKSNINKGNDSKDFIRYYSSTYQTEWEGREGELVAEVLESMRNVAKTPLVSLDYSSLIYTFNIII